jgi:hypothetical protein
MVSESDGKYDNKVAGREFENESIRKSNPVVRHTALIDTNFSIPASMEDLQ